MAKQYIYIDDSGDPGFKLGKASSCVFVISYIIFDSMADVEFANVAIKKLKKKMGWKQEREFKFHRASEEQKKKFFEMTELLKFRVRAVVVDKAKVVEPRMKKDDSFYQKIILVALNRFTEMRDAQIYLDGQAGKNYRNRSVAKIRQTLNKSGRRMAILKIKDSKNDVLIQLADMIAGSIRAKYDVSKVIKRDYLISLGDKLEEIHFYTE